MSRRGERFTFQPGEYVLCFEPDPTKARVLYDAKVLQNHSSRDKYGKKRIGYQVHFQGWNSSWDRIVPESFILKNSDGNRRLMKKLADIARRSTKNRARKRKIDQVLKMHFCEHPKFDSSDETSESSSSDDDDDEIDESDEDDSPDDTDEENDHEHEQRKNNAKQNHRKRNGTESSEEENDGENDTNNDVSDEEPPADEFDFEVGEVDLELEKNLKQKLEDDCYFIQSKNKLVHLPAEPNVITILESYVKNFAINLLCATVDKLRPRDTYPPPPEKNVELCKEVMDGLRIIFDLTLPTNLLYAPEREQYSEFSTMNNPPWANQKEQEPLESPLVQSPRLRSADIRPASGEVSPRCPRLSPRQVKREREESSDTESEEEMPTKRMTRNAYQEEIRLSSSQDIARARRRESRSGIRESQAAAAAAAAAAHELKNGPSESKRRHSSGHGSGNESKPEGNRRNSLRSSVRHSIDSYTNVPAAMGDTGSQKGGSITNLCDRITPPPPLLIPSAISSTSSRCSTPTLPDGALSDKEGALNGVLSWRLIPAETYYHQSPTPPAVIYGAHHLLRLFVKLPELISKMAIPNTALKPLLKHLTLFLQYLSERSEEFFPDSVYIDADASSSTARSALLKR